MARSRRLIGLEPNKDTTPRSAMLKIMNGLKSWPKTDRPFNYSEYKAKKPKLKTWQQDCLAGPRLPVTAPIQGATPK